MGAALDGLPPSAYTARGGVGTVSAHEAARAAVGAAEDREDDPVPPQGGAALPDPAGAEGRARRHRAGQEQDRLAA